MIRSPLSRCPLSRHLPKGRGVVTETSAAFFYSIYSIYSFYSLYRFITHN